MTHANLRFHHISRPRVWAIALALFVSATALTFATQDMGYTRDESFYFHYAESYQNWFVAVEDADTADARHEAFGRDAVIGTWQGNFEHPPLMKALFGFAWRGLTRKDRDVYQVASKDEGFVARLNASPATGFALGAEVSLLAPLDQGQAVTDDTRTLAVGRVVERVGDRVAISFPTATDGEDLAERCRPRQDDDPAKIAMTPCQVREVRAFAFLDEVSGMRLFGILSGGVACALTFILGEAFFGWLVGLLAAFFFYFVPEHFFHAHMTCFDMPIVAAQLTVLYSFWRSLSDRRWALATAVAWGAALLVKHNAFFIPVALVLWWLWTGRDQLAFPRIRPWRWLQLPPLPLAFLVMLIVGIPMLFVFWPRLWFEPLHAVVDYFQFHLSHEHYLEYWFGAPLQVPPFPVSFPTVKTALTYPEVYLYFFAIGAYLLVPLHRVRHFLANWRLVTPKDRAASFLLLNGLIPLLVISLPSVPIFGGIKHWMTGSPLTAIIASYAVVRLLHELAAPRVLQWALALSLVAYPVAASVGHSRLGTGYFNSLLAGGLPGAADKRLMRHFWGYTTYPALDWLNTYAPRNARVFWNDTTHGSFEMYQRMGLLRHDVRYHSGFAGADIALMDPMQAFFELDQQTRRDFNLPAPEAIVARTSVPYLHIYTRKGRVQREALLPEAWEGIWR